MCRRQLPTPHLREKTTMRYKTICLELIKERPQLHEQLRANRTLLLALDDYAIGLKASHEQWLTRFSEVNPHKDRSQLSSEALETAIEELQESLPCEPAEPADEPFSL